MKASKFKSIVNAYDNGESFNNYTSFNTYIDNLKKIAYTLETERLSFPTEIFIELTDKCNLDCVYCYKKSTQQKKDDTLNITDIKQIAKNIGYSPSTLVILEGGEPLLHPEFIEIFAELKKYYIPVDIITNGVYLDAELISKISKTFDKDYDDFQISLDGINGFNALNRGISSEKVLQGIERLNHFGIKPRINCVVTNRNYLGIIEFISYLNHNYEINALSLNTPIGNKHTGLILEDEIAEKLYKDIMSLRNNLKFSIFANVINIEKDCIEKNIIETPHMRCTAMRSKICISSCGDIYPCVFMENKIKPLGNIRKHTLQEIWTSSRSEIFVEELVKKSQKCINCENSKYCAQVCAGGE